MAQMYHTQDSPRSRPRWLGVTLSICVAAALVLFLPLLIGGIVPPAGANPPPDAAWSETLTTGDQLRTTGAYTTFFPLAYNYHRAPLNCTPQVWYTFSSFGSTPMGMAYDVSRTRLFVANYAGPGVGSLAVINAYTGQKIRVVDDIPDAYGVAFDAKRNRIYVAGGIRLSVVDGTSYGVWAKIPIGVNEPAGAHAVAYNPTADKIYVAGYQDGSITIVNAATWSVITTLTHQEIVEPADIVVNPVTNKVYVSNHNHGAPYGWVTVIDGNTNQVLRSIPLGGDLYGIAVDSVHNRVYVTSISAARLYVINGSTDTRVGDIQIWNTSLDRPMPLRMVAVNPSAGSDIHLWLTSSDGDMWGRDRLLLLYGAWLTIGQPLAAAVAPSPEGGLLFDPTSWYIFVSNMNSNLVTVSQDSTSLCMSPLSLSVGQSDSEDLRVIVNDYSHPPVHR
jgi:DNA-binding beta-propeller fold protein YncE